MLLFHKRRDNAAYQYWWGASCGLWLSGGLQTNQLSTRQCVSSSNSQYLSSAACQLSIKKELWRIVSRYISSNIVSDTWQNATNWYTVLLNRQRFHFLESESLCSLPFDGYHGFILSYIFHAVDFLPALLSSIPSFPPPSFFHNSFPLQLEHR